MKIDSIVPDPTKNSDVQRLKQNAEKTKSSVDSQLVANGELEDKLTISSEARKLQQSELAARQAVQQGKDIRDDKVANAKEKLEDGFYFSEDAVEKLADSLIEEKFVPGIDISAILRESEVPDIREREVSFARARQVIGFYNREEIIHHTADKLLAHHLL